MKGFEVLPERTTGPAATEKEPLPPNAQLCDFLANRPILMLAEVTGYGYRVGHVITAHGIVGFYDQGRCPEWASDQHTSMDVVVSGRCYRASWPRLFSDRFLKTLASRFAARVEREQS
jgi:hypothetical protein